MVTYTKWMLLRKSYFIIFAVKFSLDTSFSISKNTESVGNVMIQAYVGKVSGDFTINFGYIKNLTSNSATCMIRMTLACEISKIWAHFVNLSERSERKTLLTLDTYDSQRGELTHPLRRRFFLNKSNPNQAYASHHLPRNLFLSFTSSNRFPFDE